MKLICEKCGSSRLVHSGHYWRYRRPRSCDCGGRLLPDESGLRQLKSRDESLLIPNKEGKVSRTARIFHRLQSNKTKIDEQTLKG